MKHLNFTKIYYAIAVLFITTVSLAQERKPAQKLFSDDNNDSDYLLAIERAGETLQSAYGDAVAKGNIFMLSGEIDNIKAKLDRILANINQTSPNVRNQQMYGNVLDQLKAELEADNKALDETNKTLTGIRQRVAKLREDATLMALIKDTVARKHFQKELLSLRSRHRSTDSILNKKLTVLNQKKRIVVDYKTALANAQLAIDSKLKKSTFSLFGREYPALWQSADSKRLRLPENLKGKLQSETDVAGYYYSYSSGGMILLFIFTLIIIWYIRRNIKILKAAGSIEKLGQLNFRYLNNGIVLPALAIGLNIAIVSNLYAPALVVNALHGLLLILLSFLFKGTWQKSGMQNWLVLVGLLLVFVFIELFIEISALERYVFVGLNVFSIWFGLVKLKNIKDQLYIKSFFKWAAFMFIGFNGLALLFNLFGRVSLAQMLSVTAIISLTQIVALSVLLKIFLEMILLQIYASRVKRGFTQLFDYEALAENLRKPFVLLITYMWLVVIASNLNIWEALRSGFGSWLATPYEVGSFSFTWGSVVLFVIIVYIAHLLQKYVAYFFGEIEDEDDENINKRQHSRLLVTRLIILICGYLLAIAASGMPMDKLSLVLGALGVGIGLGLQGIVNNFVSGIILIFDRPIQVGDIIEVSDQSGRVKSMGLRTTKINAPNGAEIIIPNGNILSENITNWTYTDNLKQVELQAKVTGNTSHTEIEAIISEVFKDFPLADAKRAVQIYYDGVSGNGLTLRIKFWCSIFRTEEALSKARQLLLNGFKDKGIDFSA